MGLIPQVKCGRCDRTYSGLRSRCPYCGAHRHKRGKRTTDGDNATWKLIIGVLLIVILIAAVIVILVTSSNEKRTEGETGQQSQSVNNANEGSQTGQGSQSGQGDQTGEGEQTGQGDQTGEGEQTGQGGQTGGQSTEPSVPATVIASSVSAKSLYVNPVKDFTVKIGETQPVTAVITPSNVTSIPVWTSDSAAISVIPADETGMKVNVTGMSIGVANITVSVDGLEYTFVVRCN